MPAQPPAVEICPLIGDLSLSHFLFDGQSRAVAIVDWEYAGHVGLVADDLAGCIFRSFMRRDGSLNLRAIAALAESYERERACPPEFWRTVSARLYVGAQAHALTLLDRWLSGAETHRRKREFVEKRLVISYRVVLWLLDNFNQVRETIERRRDQASQC